MLTYATILIASLIVALVVLFFYKIVSDSSRSIFRSKQPIALTESTANHPIDKTAHNTVTSASVPPGGKARVTPPPKINQIYPAMPTETIDWGWQGSGNKLREQNPQHGASAGNVAHCSLYDVSTAEPTVNSNQQTGWPHREDKIESGGKAYKVTRKVVSKHANPETTGKPWGW